MRACVCPCSYTFAFKGPAVSVDTACSSSLVASHIAAGNIFSGVTVAGLTAGAGLLLSPDTTGGCVARGFSWRWQALPRQLQRGCRIA
jgi:acyl transferase domain-containing protein